MFHPPLAHLGHWYMWLLYAAPALVVFGATGHSTWAQRRDTRNGTIPPPASTPPVESQAPQAKNDPPATP